MKEINLIGQENFNDSALIRFGYIGDLITAGKLSKSYNLKLIAYENKRKLLFQEKNTKVFENFLKDINCKCNFEILSGLKINELRKYRKLYLFLQSKNLSAIIFLNILRYFYNLKNIEILYEGSNYFHVAVLTQNKTVLKKIKRKIKISKNKLKIALCWKGKEIQKNLSLSTIKILVDFFERKKNNLIIIGDKKINVMGRKILNISGKTNLKEAMDNIDNSDIIISVDTGLLHYAVLKNKLCIALVAHRYTSSLWYPFNSKTYFIGDIFTKSLKNNYLNQNLVIDEIKKIFE